MIRQVDYETVKSNRHTIMTATDPSMIWGERRFIFNIWKARVDLL
jgi:hypothetical protein